MFAATVDALATPIRRDERIIGDVPYTEFLANREILPPHVTDAEREALRSKAVERFRERTGLKEVRDYGGEFGTVFGMGRNFGHIIAGYPRPLRIGFGGIQREIEAQRSALSNEESQSRRDFLDAARFTVLGAQRYIRRYGEEAQRLAAAEQDGKRQTELQRLGEMCAHISIHPPRHFHEALQLVWFTQLLLEIESGVSAFSFGRLDQYLYPYLRADLDSGALTAEAAQELVDCFWIVANEQNDRCVDAGRAVTIGGSGQDGGDRVNDLTYMMLNAAGRLRLKQPKLNARFHTGSPADYMRRCCEVAARNTGPQFYNDAQIVPSLVRFGLPESDAVDYGIIGCYETGIPGKERPWPMSGCLNLGKCLELAINNGMCRLSGRQIGPRTGRLSECVGYEEIWQAYRTQVGYFASRMAEKNALDECMDAALRPQPFLSALMQGCVESGKDVSAGGALYTNVGVRCTGFSAVSDSLAALKTLAFERGEVTLQALEAALSEDFASGESLRQMLANRAPKYGNDREDVDDIAREVGEHFCRTIAKHRGIHGGRLKPGLFSFTSFLPAGKQCGALPSGRKARRPFANGVGPMHGADRNGPTAMLRSASRLNYLLSPNANTLDLKLSPSSVSAGIGRLGEMIRTYFQMGGMQLQLSVLSSRDLRQAQRRPDDYADLLVRVAGYSAYFVALDRDVQEEIIRRSEHRV